VPTLVGGWLDAASDAFVVNVADFLDIGKT
jgi:hypothetical protein